MTEMRRWIRGMRNSAEQTIAQQQHGQERILSDNMLLSGVLYRSKSIFYIFEIKIYSDIILQTSDGKDVTSEALFTITFSNRNLN